MQIDVVENAAGAARLLDRLQTRFGDPRPQLLGLLDTIIEAERKRFEGENRWRKLADSTIREKGSSEPLIRTGALMRSLTQRGASGQHIEVRRDRLVFGTRVHYAVFMQKGAAWPSKERAHRRVKGARPQSTLRVPRRAVVGFTRVQRVELIEQLRHLLLEHL